jgi:hypothetical protein
MNVNPKPAKETATDAAAEKMEAPEISINNVAELVHKGVERMAQLHKTTLDVVNQQATDMNTIMKQAFRGVPAIPGLFLYDLGLQAMNKWAEAQKGMVDLFVEQSAGALDLVKHRTETMKVGSEELNEFVRNTADRTAAVYRMALDFAATQNKNVADAVKRQAGVAGTPIAAAAEATQRNVESVIDAQKEMVEAAVKQTKTAMAKS